MNDVQAVLRPILRKKEENQIDIVLYRDLILLLLWRETQILNRAHTGTAALHTPKAEQEKKRIERTGKE